MTLSTLPLGYCTNVHPGQSVAEVEAGLDRFTVPAGANVGGPLAAGLWLARPVVSELLSAPDGVRRFAERLHARGLSCHTLNAFPYGDFHSTRVKENVYLPDWSEPARLAYTQDCARVLAMLLPPGAEGSISTVPLAFKPLRTAAAAELSGLGLTWADGDGDSTARATQGRRNDPENPQGRGDESRQATVPVGRSAARFSGAGADFLAQVAGQLVELARWLARLREETGRVVRLAIEPEPLCLIETTDETVIFFDLLRARAADEGELAAVETHLGVCYDVCHQAVEFEDVADSIRRLAAARIRINKVHITCAIELDHPARNREGRAELARYVEPRYLHQTIGRSSSGALVRAVDLTNELALEPDDEFRTADVWRVHFHVPVDAERLGPLRTTRAELRQALAAVAGLDYAPHLEVETYTWPVLPDGERTNLVEGLTRELLATRELLHALGGCVSPRP